MRPSAPLDQRVCAIYNCPKISSCDRPATVGNMGARRSFRLNTGTCTALVLMDISQAGRELSLQVGKTTAQDAKQIFGQQHENIALPTDVVCAVDDDMISLHEKEVCFRIENVVLN